MEERRDVSENLVRNRVQLVNANRSLTQMQLKSQGMQLSLFKAIVYRYTRAQFEMRTRVTQLRVRFVGIERVPRG